MPRIITSLVVLFTVLGAAPAAATLYLELDVLGLGPIRGESTFPAERDRIEILDFQQNSTVPIDPFTGLPGGNIDPGAFIFTKAYDRATVPMLAAFGGSRVLSRFIVRAYRPSQLGGVEHYFTVELTGGAFEQRTVTGVSGDSGFETWFVSFQSVTWRDEINNVQWTDSFGGSTTLSDPLARNETELAPVPNPTSGRTAFSFRLPESGQVTIDVFDLRGRRIASVFDGPVFSTDSIVEWDGSDDFGQPVAQGVYLVKMRSGEWLTTRKLSVVR